MAMADYYLCDVCECKTFYNAELYYEHDENGEDVLPGVGDMKVICKPCAATHRVVIEKPEVK